MQQEGSAKEVCERYLQAFYEAQQGRSSTTKLMPSRTADTSLPSKDQRLSFINATPLRNDLRIFRFDPDAPSFGKGGATIYDVCLLDENEHPLAWIVGGEKVTLRILVQARQDMDSPIVGFYVKDRLGQALFGDNTFLSCRDRRMPCPEGSEVHANFVFHMPLLPAGEYSITVAIADGTQEGVHIQHHWIHDAVLFRSESGSVSTGIIGIPMLGITLMTRDRISSLPER
jgi:lipopolysaccharide transport system ATP-binding protein